MASIKEMDQYMVLFMVNLQYDILTHKNKRKQSIRFITNSQLKKLALI